jgi:hypothetical protein
MLPASDKPRAAKERLDHVEGTGKQSHRRSVVQGVLGSPWNPRIVDELAAPDMLLQYSLHAPRRGRADVTAFMRGFRAAFPDLNFWGAPRNCARPAKARSYPDIRETFLRIARDYDLIADNIEAADSLRITKTPSDAPR